jgi:hypothetical protein
MVCRLAARVSWLAAVALVFDEHDNAGDTDEDWPENIYRLYSEQTLFSQKKTSCEKNHQDRNDTVMAAYAAFFIALHYKK